MPTLDTIRKGVRAGLELKGIRATPRSMRGTLTPARALGFVCPGVTRVHIVFWGGDTNEISVTADFGPRGRGLSLPLVHDPLATVGRILEWLELWRPFTPNRKPLSS